MGVYVVTGSAGGIGGGIRRRIESEGHDVIGVDLRNAEVEADLSEPAGRHAAWEAVATHASGHLDGVVACAGLGGTVRPVSLVAKVNYFGAVATLDGLYPLLLEGRGRAAVAICSNSASFFTEGDHELVSLMLAGDEEAASRLADEMDGQLVYSQAKLALARALRRRVPEWGAAGIRLNGVAPGPVLTALTREGLEDPVSGPAIRDFPVPLGRWGEPEEIGAAVWFLLGPEASWVHGSVLFADGGTDALVRPDAL